MWKNWSRGHEKGRAGRLSSSDTTQAQIQVFELAHANTFPNYELLEHVKGLVLWIHSLRILGTLGNDRIPENL